MHNVKLKPNSTVLRMGRVLKTTIAITSVRLSALPDFNFAEFSLAVNSGVTTC